MTPNELAELLSPEVRTAADHSRADIVAGLPMFHRIIVKAIWPLAMRSGVPAAIRIVIEFGIARYRRDLEPTIGEFVNGMADAIEQEGNVPALAIIKGIIGMLRTPAATFLPAVRLTLGGSPLGPEKITPHMGGRPSSRVDDPTLDL